MTRHETAARIAPRQPQFRGGGSAQDAGRSHKPQDRAHRHLRPGDPPDPDHAEARHLLGVVAYKTGHHAAAADLIRRAIARNPGEAAYHGNLGLVYEALGQPADAVACYEQVLCLQPDSADAHNVLGNALAKSLTAKADPTYCDSAPMTNSPWAGSRPSPKPAARGDGERRSATAGGTGPAYVSVGAAR